jgi:hypothetical protein
MANFTSLIEMDEINSSMSWTQWRSTIVPIGALFSASLCFNNVAYISLSVPFIQMCVFPRVRKVDQVLRRLNADLFVIVRRLKAFTSVAVLSM